MKASSEYEETTLTIQPSIQATPKLIAPAAEKTTKASSGCGCPHEAAPAPAESVSLSQTPVEQRQPPKEQPPTGEKPPETPPTPPKVKVAVYAQDPYVNKPMIMDINQSEIGKDLVGDRVRTRDERAHAKPDADGNYLLAEGSDGISQVNAHAYTSRTLKTMEEYRGSKIDWATRGEQISVTPHKQEGRNAYYSRWGGGTAYFYSPSPGLGTVLKTANSTDVVAHETNHAVLDGLRPGYFGTHDLETGAFHEAFGDCGAMLMALNDESNRALILEQSGGNLRNHNAMSSLAEEFGAAVVKDNSDPADDHRIYLRTALNDFRYQDPNTLPPGRGDHDNMGAQVHSFSRLFSASFYDAIESIYMQSIYDDKQCPAEALQTAEKVAGPLLLRAVEAGSTSRARYKDLALAMISSDKQLNEGKYSDGLKEVFLKRNIITAEDIAQAEQRQANIPSVELPAGEMTPANSVNFLEANAEKLGLPADLPYTPDNVTKNGKGETFVSYRYAQEVPVTVDGLTNLVTDVQGGVNLVFNPEGKLIDMVHTEITPETVQAEMAGIAALKDQNAIIEKEKLDLFKSGVDTSVYKSSIQGNKLVRIPVSACDHDHSHAGHQH